MSSLSLQKMKTVVWVNLSTHDRMCGNILHEPKRDYMSSAERKTTGSTFMIGCVVKTKERLQLSYTSYHEQLPFCSSKGFLRQLGQPS